MRRWNERYASHRGGGRPCRRRGRGPWRGRPAASGSRTSPRQGRGLTTKGPTTQRRHAVPRLDSDRDCPSAPRGPPPHPRGPRSPSVQTTALGHVGEPEVLEAGQEVGPHVLLPMVGVPQLTLDEQVLPLHLWTPDGGTGLGGGIYKGNKLSHHKLSNVVLQRRKGRRGWNNFSGGEKCEQAKGEENVGTRGMGGCIDSRKESLQVQCGVCVDIFKLEREVGWGGDQNRTAM